MSKMSRYRELKLKEKAQTLSLERGISFEDALRIVKNERYLSDQELRKRCKRKSKSKQKRESRILAKERNKSINEFGVKLIPGAPAFQGGAPGSGKKK